jgi:hypothetical protein
MSRGWDAQDNVSNSEKSFLPYQALRNIILSIFVLGALRQRVASGTSLFSFPDMSQKSAMFLNQTELQIVLI